MIAGDYTSKYLGDHWAIFLGRVRWDPMKCGRKGWGKDDQIYGPLSNQFLPPHIQMIPNAFLGLSKSGNAATQSDT